MIVGRGCRRSAGKQGVSWEWRGKGCKTEIHTWPHFREDGYHGEEESRVRHGWIRLKQRDAADHKIECIERIVSEVENELVNKDKEWDQ
jgi:hypothetical protein